MEFVVPILIILFLLLASAFFSGGELAMMALDPISIETGVRKGTRLARLQKFLRSRPQRFLSTILIGYNVANIVLTAYVTVLSVNHLGPIVGEERATLYSTLAVMVVILIFAELMPKTVAAIRTQEFARWATIPLYVIDWLLTPLTWLIDKGVMPIIRLMTGGKQSMENVVGPEELQTALKMAFSSGQLSEESMSMAHEAVTFSEHSLEDAMTPRVDIVAVAEGASLREALELMHQSGFSRLPVYRENFDQILGSLYIKDIIESLLNDEEGTRLDQLPVMDFLREVPHFPHTKDIPSSLNEMRQARSHLAVVVDEHGGTAGVVTLEDIIEELVGEIHDETDHLQSAQVLKSLPGYSLVNGRARPEQIKELEGIELPETQANTIGGLMMEVMGRPAITGDELELHGIKLTALKVQRNQIKLLRVERTAESPEAAGPAADQP